MQSEMNEAACVSRNLDVLGPKKLEKWREAMGQARDQIINLKQQRDAMRGGSGSSAGLPSLPKVDSPDVE